MTRTKWKLKDLPSLFWLLILLLPTGIAPSTVYSEQQKQDFTIKVATQLVITNVVVKDRNGKVMEGLTAKDFVLTEDDQPQEISIFEFNKLEDAPIAPMVDKARLEEEVHSRSPEQISSSAFKSSGQYQNRRLLVLFFDTTTMRQLDLNRSLMAAREFIQKHMTGSDLISIVAYVDGSIQTLKEFTDDRHSLLEILDRLIYPEYQDRLYNTGSFGQDSSEFSLFNTDRRLAGLQTAVNMLKSVNENKYLIYFASGLRLNDMENQAQMRATINAAVRANVAIFPIDTRGLEAFAPLGNASEASPGGIGMYTGEFAMAKMKSLQQSQDSFYALAADTGGKALLDNNDLTEGIIGAQRATTSYYTIGYYPANRTLDGKFRRIKVALKEVPNARLEFRGGYFAGKTFGKFNEFDRERQLEEALMLGDPITEIPIAMEVNYFKLNSAEYFVSVHAKMPGTELLLADDRGNDRTRMDFIGEVKDSYGNTIRNMRDMADIKLGRERLQALATKPIQFDTGFTLLPGNYIIKFLARNAETGRIGTYETSFVIPNLMKPLKTIPISSVVLGNQLVKMDEAIYSSARDKKARSQINNPLVSQGQKLIPSVTRVFSRNRELFLYLQAYPQGSVQVRRLVAYVTLYRNNMKAFEAAPVALGDDSASESKVFSFRFNLSLSKLPPGEYSLQVSVLDPGRQKVAFWQAPVMLVDGQ